MGKKCLNERRLTKKQVEAIIAKEGKFHPEYSAISDCLVYELSGDRFLLVFDPNGFSIPGRGDIYPKEYFERWMRSMQKRIEDCKNARGSSGEHWRYYSKYKSNLIHKIDELMLETSECLQLDSSALDYSYKSLDIVSAKAEEYGLDLVQAELYDNLVAYVGEVLRRRVNASWAVREDSTGRDYPFISVQNWVLMPINVVWAQLQLYGEEPIDLRKETANEVRRFALSRC